MTVQTAYCVGCDGRVEVAEGRCWPSGHLVGHPVEPRCGRCGFRLDRGEVSCRACGATNQKEATAA